MAAQHAKLIFAGFVGISCAMAGNAIYSQKGAHPAPISAKTADLAPSRRATRRRVSGGAETTIIRATQRELRAKDYDPGPVDSVMGLLTRAAVMAYQNDVGLPVTGEPTPELLEHLILGMSVAPIAKNPKVPVETTALVKAVQQILADQGYAPGSIDGIVGDETRTAIKAMERDRGLVETGRVSGKLLHAIVEATGANITNSSFD